MKREEAMLILQIYKDEIEQRIDEADAPDVKDVYRWQMDGFCMAIEALSSDTIKICDIMESCEDCPLYGKDCCGERRLNNATG